MPPKKSTKRPAPRDSNANDRPRTKKRADAAKAKGDAMRTLRESRRGFR